MKYPSRRQDKHAKVPYRVLNWPEYEAGLRRRGDTTVWFSDDAIQGWRAQPSGRPGGQRLYSAVAIETALTVRMVFSSRCGKPRASCARYVGCSSSTSASPTTAP